MTATVPNFLHLGPGKSGSTWLHETLIRHPEVYLSPAKDLYFFSRYFDRGLPWYQAQFDGAGRQAVIGEFSPDYLCTPRVPERVRDSLGSDVRLMVTLREPVDRALSSYLYLQKHGMAAPTFRATVEARPELIDEGRYATHLRRFVAAFGRARIHISIFDDLQADPQAYLDDVTDWLRVGRQPLPAEALQARLPASKARWAGMAVVAQRGADWARRHDAARAVGVVKRSAAAQRLLYKPLGSGAPVMSAGDADYVRDRLYGEVSGVDDEFGLALARRWDWT